MFLEGHALQVRASMGVALYPEHGASAAQLLRSADQAMYAAKRVDDSAVVVFEREVDHSAMRRLRLTGDLRDALNQQQFELHFQNIVNLQRRRVDCAEALLRWRHPELGMVSPAEFVPLLERRGLIVPVGLWALRHACDQLRAWQANGALIEAVAVNVSVVQLAQSDFSSDALAVLAASGVDPACVTIEVTESVLMDNPERSIAQLQTLRDAGLRIAIDDFGAGYSSLAYLRRLPVQVMKIDRALLIDAVHPTGRAILSAMVDLAAELGLDCIAEGVETLEQYGLLFDIGCHRLQGYLFARPMPAGRGRGRRAPARPGQRDGHRRHVLRERLRPDRAAQRFCGAGRLRPSTNPDAPCQACRSECRAGSAPARRSRWPPTPHGPRGLGPARRRPSAFPAARAADPHRAPTARGCSSPGQASTQGWGSS